MECSLSGASKTQVIREFKNRYKLDEKDIEYLLDCCSFKKKPRNINYLEFYKNRLTTECEKFKYPITQIYKYENFLTDSECTDMITFIDSRLTDSTVADPNDSCLVNDYRTSQSASLGYFEDDFFLNIDKKLVNLLDLNPFIGENMQGQKYLPGQYYKEHHDFFTPFTAEYKTYCEWMGQRTWTTMLYLNDVEEGGETHFKHLKLKIKPKKGLLIAWNNLFFNGIPNYKTLHEALPPISGEKYIITKWWRSWSLI